jgi:hypothetical protein
MVTESGQSTNNFFTNKTDGTLSVCGLVAGSYTVSESMSGYMTVGLSVNGAILPPESSYLFSWQAGKPDPSLVFQNRKMELQ